MDIHAILTSFSPFDIIVGIFSFMAGAVAMLQRYKNNPYRNLSIFLQVSILVINMAKQYYDHHPDAKEKLNKKIVERLDKISDQLYEYIHGRKEPQVLPPVG